MGTLTEQESEIVERMEDVVKRGAAAVGAAFTKEDDDWYPQAFFGAPDGIDVICLPLESFNSAESKNHLATALAVGAKVGHASVVGLLLSCWAAEVPADVDIHPRFRASKAPNRRDMLQLLVYTADEVRAQQAFIVRESGKPPTLTPWETPPDEAQHVSRFDVIQEALKENRR